MLIYKCFPLKKVLISSEICQKVAFGLCWSTWYVGLGYFGCFDADKVLTPEEEKVK